MNTTTAMKPSNHHNNHNQNPISLSQRPRSSSSMVVVVKLALIGFVVLIVSRSLWTSIRLYANTTTDADVLPHLPPKIITMEEPSSGKTNQRQRQQQQQQQQQQESLTQQQQQAMVSNGNVDESAALPPFAPPLTNIIQNLKAPSSSSSASSNNHTLVILMGNLRGGEKAWKTLHKHVLDENSADLALLIGDTRPAYYQSSLFARAKYYWKFSEFEDWGDAINLLLKNDTSWRQRVLPKLHNWSTILGGVKYRKFSGSGGVILIIRWFLSLIIQQLQLTTKYTRFVITRSDHYYLCPHNFQDYDLQRLHVPKGEDNKGITDRHLIVSSEHILTALNILPPLLENPDPYSALLARRAGNPEKMIKRRWKDDGLNITRFDRVMFTCAEPGDMTRWRIMSEQTVKPERVRLKYPQEYNASYVTCGKTQQELEDVWKDFAAYYKAQYYGQQR